MIVEIKRLTSIWKNDSLDEVIVAKWTSQFRFKGTTSIFTILVWYKDSKYYFQVNEKMSQKSFSTKEDLIEEIKVGLKALWFKDAGIELKKEVSFEQEDEFETSELLEKYHNTPLTATILPILFKQWLNYFYNDTSKVWLAVKSFLIQGEKLGSQVFKKKYGVKTWGDFQDMIRKILKSNITATLNTWDEILTALHTYADWRVLWHPDNLVTLDFVVGTISKKLKRSLTKLEVVSLLSNTSDIEIAKTIEGFPEPKVKERKWYTSYFDWYYFAKEWEDRLREYYSISTPDESKSVISPDYDYATSLFRSLSFNQIDIWTFLYRLASINLNPDYQRWEIWTLQDKQKLIQSIMEWRDIWKFTFYAYDHEDYIKNNRYQKEVIDGKQRLSTIRDFITGQFQYKWKYYFEFTQTEKNIFKSHMISTWELRARHSWGKITKKDILKAFLLLNTAGTPVDTKVLENAQKMLDEEVKQSK